MTLLRIKEGVRLTDLQPQMALVVQAAICSFGARKVDTWITSANDSTHMAGSLHYSGRALDFRTKHLQPGEAELIAAELRDALGAEFDVVLEIDHCHIEYDPKGELVA